MPKYTTWYVVLLVRHGSKEREVKSPGVSDQFEAQQELDVVRAAMKEGSWVDLPWFSANAESVSAAYLDSTSFGIY